MSALRRRYVGDAREVIFAFIAKVHYCLYGDVFVCLAKYRINGSDMQDMEAV